MAKKLALLVAATAVAGAFALTPVLDRDLSEWVGPDVGTLGVQPAPDGGTYEILYTFDASNFYLGIDRSSSGRYLGDIGWTDDSFFFMIDVNGGGGGGAALDGYSRMNFAGPLLPDYGYYFAGGNDANGGWHERNAWDSGAGAWNWLGWRSDPYAIYGQPASTGLDDEIMIPLSELGGATEFTVWAWMTREGNGYLEATWPAGASGPDPGTMTDGIYIPEPSALLLLALGATLLRRR